MKERSGMPYDVVAFSTDERALMLTLDEEGAFHRLMRHAWINGSIPDDLPGISKICRCTSLTQMRKLWPALESFWPVDPLDPSRRVNPKQESEREYKDAKSNKNKESAAKRWAIKRRADALQASTANAMRTHMPTQCEGNAPLPSPPLPIPSLLKDPSLVLIPNTGTVLSLTHSVSPKKRATGYTPEFEIFWKVYPKKRGKGEAFKVWQKNGHPPVEQVVLVVERAKRAPDWIKESGQFIPKPAKWLNQKCWDDEYVTIDDERAAAEVRHRQIYGDKLR